MNTRDTGPPASGGAGSARRVRQLSAGMLGSNRPVDCQAVEMPARFAALPVESAAAQPQLRRLLRCRLSRRFRRWRRRGGGLMPCWRLRERI